MSAFNTADSYFMLSFQISFTELFFSQNGEEKKHYKKASFPHHNNVDGTHSGCTQYLQQGYPRSAAAQPLHLNVAWVKTLEKWR